MLPFIPNSWDSVYLSSLQKQCLSEANHSLREPKETVQIIRSKPLILLEETEVSGKLTILLEVAYPAISRDQEGMQDALL